MPRRLDKTLIDYLVIAISPALIMTLIGSLVFFLLEVFYRGEYEVRLHFIFGLFVFAAVLVARIAIEEGREHAQMFAIFLGIVTFLALQRFVQLQGGGLAEFGWAINLALVALILWCADKLTWDCTLIDETRRDSGRGLLEAVGLDRPPATSGEPDADETSKPEGVTSRETTLSSWWDRYLERRRRPHASGVWVVYFSLAALPLFGIGQLFIPAEDLASRQYAFCLLLIYVASGLGLLLATSFLGLRRYLRQRRVEMPTTMANVWLAVGCILVVVLLVFAALLPRPNAEYAISQLPFTIGSPDRRPSRYAVGNDGAEADKGAPRSGRLDEEDESKSGERGGGNGGKSAKQDGQGEPKSGKRDGQGEPKSGRQDGQSESEPDKQDRESASKSRKQDGESRSQSRQEGKPADDRGGRLDRRPPAGPQDLVRSISREVATLLKWIFYIAVVLIGAYWLWRSRAELLAALRGLLQGWGGFWQSLFGRKGKEAEKAAAAEGSLKLPLPRPFTDFADPFATGSAGRYSPDELVRYSFEALEAWAREHGCAREPEQTPHEFARNVGAEVPSLFRDARTLADLYCRVAYAPGTLPAASVDPLKQLWRQLWPRVVPANGAVGPGNAVPGAR